MSQSARKGNLEQTVKMFVTAKIIARVSPSQVTGISLRGSWYLIQVSITIDHDQTHSIPQRY